MSEQPERILLVGAGAVGQAYGRHLQLGGADVTFFTKPKYADEARAGFTLYALNTRAGKRREPVRMEGFGVVTSADEVGATRWDQVWLCVSATALRGPWLDELVGEIGEATLVALTPGLEDRAFVAARYPEARIVSGLINMISYQAPLEGEVVPEPGVAYWFPSKSPFSGDERARVDAVVDALNRGGGKAKRVADASRAANFGSATLMPVLVALEAADWRFAAVRKAPELKLAVRASREAQAIVAAYRDENAPWHRVLVRPATLRLLTRLAPRVIPLDVETYLGYHFTKVGDQTRFMLERYVELGTQRGLETKALRELIEVLERVRAEPATDRTGDQKDASAVA